jgi:hypothetical protein
MAKGMPARTLSCENFQVIARERVARMRAAAGRNETAIVA